MQAPASTMKALVVTEFGPSSEVIKLSSDAPIPSIDKASSEILVQVHYAAIHRGDWKTSKGDLGGMASLMGFKPPYHPGQDYSGKVVEMGSKVKNFKIGDAVFGQVRLGHGTAVQYIIVTEEHEEIFLIPPQAPFSMAEAAGATLSLETAYQSLTDYTPLQEGESLLILGGSTVVGLYAIQLAKKVFKAKHVAVTSSSVELCKQMGADQVVNYRETKWPVELENAQFDCILDVMGGSQSWTDCQQYNVLKAQGSFITVAGDFPENDPITCCVVCSVMCAVLCRSCGACCCGGPKYHAVNQVRSKSMEAITKFMMDGSVKVAIDEDSPYPVEEYLECYRKSEARAAHGKTVLKFVNDGSAGPTKENDVVEEEPKNDADN